MQMILIFIRACKKNLLDSQSSKLAFSQNYSTQATATIVNLVTEVESYSCKISTNSLNSLDGSKICLIDFEKLPYIFPVCQKCKKEMKIKTAKTKTFFGNRFWGCDNFRKCKSPILHIYYLHELTNKSSL